MQITQFEVHNHETDKSDEVRIAVLNSTLPNSLDDAFQLIIPLAYKSLTALLLKSPSGEPVIIIRRIDMHAGSLKAIH